MRTSTTGSPGPCATPSPTGATAGETRHRHSPSPHTSGGAGDGPDDGRERVGGGQCRGTPPPGGAGPPDPRPPHNTARRRGVRHLPPERGRRQRARGGTHCPAAHEPLTAVPHGRPQPASAARRRLGEQGSPARTCTRVRLSQGREARGKSATPQGQNLQAPPRGRRGAAPGDQRASPSPSPPSGPRADGGRPERQRPRTPPGRPLRAGGGGGAPRPRQAPRVNRLHAPAPPATDRRRTGGAQDGANGAAPSEAGLGKAGARTRARRPLPPSPPPRRTDPLAADRAAPDAHGRPETPTARVYPRGARRRQRMADRHPTGRGGGGWRSPPPPLPLPSQA